MSGKWILPVLLLGALAVPAFAQLSPSADFAVHLRQTRAALQERFEWERGVGRGFAVTLLATEGGTQAEYLKLKEDFHRYIFDSLSGWCCCTGLLEVLARNHGCCCCGLCYCSMVLW